MCFHRQNAAAGRTCLTGSCSLYIPTANGQDHTRLYKTLPGVEKDEFEIETGAKHEHVAVQFDLGDGAARKRVSNGNESGVLVAAVEWRHVEGALTHLQIAAAVNHLRHDTTSQQGRTQGEWQGWIVTPASLREKKYITHTTFIHQKPVVKRDWNNYNS